jgi:hypothetical protein
MLLDHFKLSDLEENIPFPVDFQDICGIIIKKFFFENEADVKWIEPMVYFVFPVLL